MARMLHFYFNISVTLLFVSDVELLAEKSIEGCELLHNVPDNEVVGILWYFA